MTPILDDWDFAHQRNPDLTVRDFAQSIGKSYAATRKALQRAKKKSRPPNARVVVTEPDPDPAFREKKEKSDFTADGNRATAESISDRIMSVDDLVKHLNIDLEIWIIERSVVNKWEGYRKDKRTSMEYDQGLATGFVEDSGKLHIAPLFQVKIWLVKRHPEALSPVISPVLVVISEVGPPRPRIGSWHKALILADPHWGFRRDFRTGKLTPFHDRRALSIALQIAAEICPEKTIFAGDIFDLSDWTDKFLRSPELYWTTQPAITEAAEWMGKFRSVCAEMDVIEGNHDERLHRTLLAHFISAYDLRPADRLEEAPPMSIPGLLGLERLGVNYIGDYPNGRVMLNQGIQIIHGNTARSGYGSTASAILNKASISVGYGHIHRMEYLSKTIWRGDQPSIIHAFSPGCLCRIDGKVPGSPREAEWQQGIAVVYYDPDGWEHSIEPIAINNGKAHYQGRVYEGIDE